MFQNKSSPCSANKFAITPPLITVGIILGGITPIAWAQDYIAPSMVNIPTGEFYMGAEGGDPATMPIHKVSVDAFQMAKYTVTVAEFRKFADDTGFSRETTCNDYIDSEGLRGPTYKGSGRWNQHRETYSEYQPVVCISFEDANAYAEWLSIKTGTNYRLPTEQEWEYAAKANTTSRYFWGDDPDLTKACQYGNFADHTGEYVNNQKYGYSNVGFIEHTNCDDGEAYNAIVGLYRPNPFGLYDMAGNVSQYLNSCYDKDGYKPDSTSQESINSCEFIANRGGTWHYPAQPHSSRGRYKREGWNVGSGTGFRLAVDGHSNKIDDSTHQFELRLKQVQSKHLATRPKLLPSPKNLQLITLSENQFQLRWQPSSDIRVTGYEIYRSKSPLAHFYGGFYKKHYEKIETVSAEKTSVNVTMPCGGGSFRVVAKSNEQASLPSQTVIFFVEPKPVQIPGRINMQDAIALENIPMYHFEAKGDKPESYIIFKTNKNFDKSEVTATFKIDVKKSGWYQLNYHGNSFQKGEFFKLWQENKLAGKFYYDPDIDDETSTRHKVYLEQGKHQLHLSVHREGFDRWGMKWLEFTEVKS